VGHSEDYAFVFRGYRVDSGPTHCAEQPSAEFSPHNILYIDVFKFGLASEVLADEVLAVYRVVAHVELHDFSN